ncbi:MAG: thiol oxidoreductase, partial [Sphingobacteriaceae bacterium]|nr:thiol oxidoreductase [Sphingobacteriaceae bacterium]
RFGHKANTATILSQVAGAYNQDMGITSYVVPEENSKGQIQDDKLVDEPELADSILNANAFYIKTLAVPARRNVKDENVIAGKLLFSKLKCASCHIPTMKTGLDRLAALSNQRIQPFTDLLLHDMGEGLADNRADHRANGKEWRTAPLWGIGLLPRVNGIPVYLHDGRARTLEEAILWHGGEAQASKEGFKKLNKTERTKIITFLESL